MGQRMNDGQVIDAMVGALSDPFDSCHMGVTAENVASRWEISREDQDQLAVESHQRAHRATEEGYSKSRSYQFRSSKETDDFLREG